MACGLWKESCKRKACTMRRDLREGGVIASLVVQNENLPNLILIESKAKIPRVWGNLREDLGNLRDQINEDLTKNVQTLKISAKHKGLPQPP